MSAGIRRKAYFSEKIFTQDKATVEGTTERSGHNKGTQTLARKASSMPPRLAGSPPPGFPELLDSGSAQLPPLLGEGPVGLNLGALIFLRKKLKGHRRPLQTFSHST